MAESAIVKARFEDIGQFEHALGRLKESRFDDYEAYGPVNLADLELLMPKKSSKLRLASYAGAILGLISFYAMCYYSAKIYGIIVGGKPPISNVPYVVVMYEGTILLGALATFLAVLWLARLAPWRPPVDYDPRFSGDSFGIYVRCPDSEKDRAVNILRESGAQEVDEI